jgi:PadR family transcriptional regulator PadR
MLDDYEIKLLTGWEDVYKKGQLTLWILLALKEGAKHMAAIKAFISDYSQQTIEADDKSMYRALRRLHEGELLHYRQVSTPGAPDRKVYRLTDIGQHVLQAFLQRNVIDVFYNQQMQSLIREDT